MSETEKFDVVVIGAGNAALAAALAAREAGASVAILEKAPESLRGGDTYFSGGAFRFAYRGINDILPLVPDLSEAEVENIQVHPYPEDAFYNDYMRITHSRSDSQLAEVIVNQSYPVMKWMMAQGVKWELMTLSSFPTNNRLCWPEGTLVLQGKGAGAGLSDMLFSIAAKKGVKLYYETQAVKLLGDSAGRVRGVTVKDRRGFRDMNARGIVLACGGFQASPEMRAKYLGPRWDTAKVRGTRFDTGDGIRMALELGAQSSGQWSGCHATPIDAKAPDFADRLSTDKSNRLSYWAGIMLNTKGRRFVDEGEDFWTYTYAKFGGQILQQPDSLAFQLFDSKVMHLLESRYTGGTNIESDKLAELIDRAGIDYDEAIKCIEEFNKSVPGGTIDPIVLDEKRTEGIYPPKSNWSQKIDSPPFVVYPVTCGITFTYGGLRINEHAQVMDTAGQDIPGLYAAGELVGGLFHDNYPGGTGLMAGAVFGHLAGVNAAKG